MKRYISIGLSAVASFFLPVALFAQGSTDATDGINKFAGLITTVNTTVVKAAGTLFMSLAVVAFFFGIVEYIWGLREGDTKKTQTGNQFMGWGLVALFVMFSVYGIVRFGQGIFNIQNTNTITIPTITTGNSGTPGGAGGTSGTGNQGSTGDNPLGTSGAGNQTAPNGSDGQGTSGAGNQSQGGVQEVP